MITRNRMAAGLLAGTVLFLAAMTAAFAETNLVLVNGWFKSPFGTARPSVTNIKGIAHLEGAIATSGTNPVPFTLPAGFRPTAVAFVPIDTCNSTNGRLQIEPTGVVTVQAEGGAFSNAACFTSLDGVEFAVNASGGTPLTLQNGWTNAPFGTENATAYFVGGFVYLAGAIATTGTNPVPFTLPSAFRPKAVVFVPIDLCNATNGRLQIEPTGVVTVQAEGGAFSNAACFTSLDGVSYAKNTTLSTPLTLINGWTGSPFGAAAPSVRLVGGVVHFEGAIATTGTNPEPFVLPSGFRPTTSVFVKADLCNATNGDLFIQSSGVVQVQAEGGAFSNAACFTSLDGVSFAQ